jgi:hypothetical protein
MPSMRLMSAAVIASAIETCKERGLELKSLDAKAVSGLWAEVARVGAEYRIRAGYAQGPDLVAALYLGRRWPGEIAPGWLAGLLAVDGLAAASMRVRPLSRAEAMAFMTTRLRVVRASDRLAAERGHVADVERERLDATAVAARRSMAAGSGRIYFVDIVLLVKAPDHAVLTERLETIRLEARSLGVEVEVATLRTGEAWASVLPGPAPPSVCERNLDSASLTASLLHSASDLYEPSGHLYGRSRTTGAPIVLDRFAHESHNAIVLGQTGKGKTMFTGAEMARCFMRGIRVLGVDPLGDYARLSKALGGAYVELGGGAGINPFALGAARTEAAFVAKLASVARLVGAMAGGLSRDERPALDRAARATYEAAGIGPDPATQEGKPPTLANLVDRINEEKGGQALARRLERWATGSLAAIFASDAALRRDERFFVIGLASGRGPAAPRYTSDRAKTRPARSARRQAGGDPRGDQGRLAAPRPHAPSRSHRRRPGGVANRHPADGRDQRGLRGAPPPGRRRRIRCERRGRRIRGPGRPPAWRAAPSTAVAPGHRPRRHDRHVPPA